MAYRFFLRNRNGPGQPSLDQLVFPGSVVDQMNRSFGDWHIAFACLLGKLLLSNQTDYQFHQRSGVQRTRRKPGSTAGIPIFGVCIFLHFFAYAQHCSSNPHRNRLFQVFSNLIGNATKFTAKGSISFGYKLKEKEIVFHVADTGSGISDDKIDKIFDRFIMANNQVQGTGLGLSISKIIVEKLGGKIAVQSKMETGTTFTFTLPYISANGDMKWEEKLPPASVKDNSRTSHQEMTILVAEDYQSNYDLIEAMIGKIYKLVHAHDGMEAIIFYEQYKPDLILMDIKMPNINGLDATRAIREMSADVPVIAVSAYAYEKDKIAAIESGCNDFLTKPVSADLLKMTINKYLKQK